MTLLLALACLVAAFFFFRFAAIRFGMAIAVVLVLALIVVVLDFAVPGGPFWQDSETVLFGTPGSEGHDPMGAILLAYFVGIPAILGGVIGVLAGLYKPAPAVSAPRDATRPL